MKGDKWIANDRRAKYLVGDRDYLINIVSEYGGLEKVKSEHSEMTYMYEDIIIKCNTF